MAYGGPVGPQPLLMLLRNEQLRGSGAGALNARRNGRGPNLRGFTPLQPLEAVGPLLISGLTKDSTGAALGGCIVQLYRTADDVMVEETISDGSGNYAFSPRGVGALFYVIAYKAGSPDVAGTTVNTLQGA